LSRLIFDEWRWSISKSQQPIPNVKLNACEAIPGIVESAMSKEIQGTKKASLLRLFIEGGSFYEVTFTFRLAIDFFLAFGAGFVADSNFLE